MGAACSLAFLSQAVALLLCGQARITGFTYSCPAAYLDERWADRSGRMLADGASGRQVAVIYQHADHLDLFVSLPGLCRVSSVRVYLHRYNNNYRCARAALYAQVGGLWVLTDEKPGFVEPYDAQHPDYRIELEGKNMTTAALRLAFATAGILAVSEIEVFGAPAQPVPPTPMDVPAVAQAGVRELDADGDGKLDLVLENRWVRVVLCPGRGGVVRSLVYKPTGTELACAQEGNFGLLREQLWKPLYFFADNPGTASHGQEPGKAWVETRLTGAGGMMGFTHTRKRLTLTDHSPALLVEWEVDNDPSSMTPYEYGPWMHNWAGQPGAPTHYFVPTDQGVQEFRLEPGSIKEQVNLWYWQPTRGWMALVSQPSQSAPPVGLAFVVPYPNLACFYHWAGPSSPAATAEWRHGLVKLQPGEAFRARYLLVPFSGLARVDGVCLARPIEEGEAGSEAGASVWPTPVLGAIDAQAVADKVQATVQALSLPGAPQAEAEVGWRPYPDGEYQPLARKPLAPEQVTTVFAGEVPGASGRAIVISCRLLARSQPSDEFARFFNFSPVQVAYRVAPKQKRTARVESEPAEALPRHDLQRSIVTPHVPWARPYIHGPLRALVLCDDENAREVVELAQRLDLDFTYIKFRTTREREWIWHGDRSLPTLEAAQKRLEEALERPFDVAVIAGFDWQLHLTPQLRAKLAEKVEAGMGLVAIEPCGVPPDDPLAPALGVSADNRPLGRFYTWKSDRTSYVTRGLWWPWDDQQTYRLLVPRTRRMEYRQWPQGERLAVYAEDGQPLLTATRVGKGRVLTATYDVLTHDLSYRGFAALTPIISYRGGLLLPEYADLTWPYWEHWWVLITRMIVWAAGRESGVQLEDLQGHLNERGEVVVSFKAAGQAPGPLVAVLQVTDRYGSPIAAPGEAVQDRAEALGEGWVSAQMLRGAQTADELSLLRLGARQVPVPVGQQVTATLGQARAGWNFVRIILREARSQAAVDWGLLPLHYDRPPLAIQSLEVDRDPVTDGRMLVGQGQPWARIFAPAQPLQLTVHLQGHLPLEPGWRVRAELYDTHRRLLFRGQQPVQSLERPLVFRYSAPELRNMGLEWRVAVLRGSGPTEQVLATARRRLIAQPPRYWNRLTFTSWSANFLTRCLWLHEYLMPLVEELGIDVGMDSSSELNSGKVYRNKWHNIEHSYIGLLDYPGSGVPGFRDEKFGEKAAKYAQSKNKSLLVREPCLNDPQYRARLGEALRERIREAARVGLPYDYCMGDEMSLTHYTAYFDYCFSPHCLARFRQWLQQRYGSLQELNAAWQTNFASWEQVMPMTLDEVRGRANAAPWAEFRTFMNDTLADFFSFVQRTIRQVDPGAPCGLSGTQEPKPGNGMDWWKLSSAFSYYHSYNTGWSNEMRRSFAAATGVSQSPYYAGYWQRGRVLEYNFFWCLLHDTKGISCWTTPLLLYPDFCLTEAGEDTRRLLHELRGGVWDLLRGGQRLHDGIAIHYSQPSISAALLLDHDGHIAQVRDAWVKLLEDLGLQYDFVSYEQIEKGELLRVPRRYRVLILPESIALSPAEVAAIRAFVSAGGTVIADGWCGLMDDKGRRLAQPALDELFSVGRGQAGAPGDTVAVAPALTGKSLTLRLRPAENDLQARCPSLGHSNSVPVLMAAAAGKGQAWYLNLDLAAWPLDRTAGSPNEMAVREVIGAVLERAGVVPPVRLRYQSGRPPHVEVVRYQLGKGTVLGLLGGEETEIALVRLPRPSHVYDLRAHKYLGRRAQLAAPLASACRLFLLTDTPLARPRLEVASKRVRRGESVVVRVALNAPVPVPQLVRLQVVAPDGQILGDYARNLLLHGPPAPANFVTALNDPVGKWTLRVTDLASGETSQASLEVVP
jgi:hypothetical protein